MTSAAAAADPGGSPTGVGQPTPGLLSIGEVLALLREDFPDVTISKLRFLEAEGLVEPQRTAAGYRKYAQTDLARLRFVLAAQRDRFLPLRVIREHLEALDRGEPAAETVYDTVPAPLPLPLPTHGRPPADGAGFVGSTHPADGHAALSDGELRLERHELIERAGLTDAALRDLEDNGLVTARNPGWYDSDALIIATVAASLAEYGLAPRHLRAYRATADREVGMFAQLIAPVARASTPAAKARAAEAVRELTALSAQLHAALVRTGLRGTLGH